MNNILSVPLPARSRAPVAPLSPSDVSSAALDTLQSRFALRVAARLTENADALTPDLTERLRFAREQALARAREVRGAGVEPQLGISASGAAMLGRGGAGRGWWMKLAAVLPAFALIGGLVLIQQWQDSTQVSTAAEIDAALLSDDLPPNAYSDAGFAEYLKTPGE